MHAEIGKLIEGLERGSLTRRQLMARLTTGLAFLGGGGTIASPARESPSTFRAVGLNHLALNVTDVARSRDFYIKHLGMTVARESRTSCFLTCGDNFVALFGGREAGLNHYCYAVEDYTVSSAAEKLRAQGINPRTAEGRIYFDDPDGLEVQLSARDHRL